MEAPTKICRVCGKECQLEELRANKNCSFGRNTICIECDKARKRQWRLDHPEEDARRQRASYDKHKSARQEYRKKHYVEHKDYYSVKGREWYDSNRDHKSTYDHERYMANREAVIEYQRNYRILWPERIRNRNKQWARNNQAKILQYSRHRRARKANAEGTHTYADEIAQLKRQKRRCYYCHEKIEGDQWHIDHVVPLSRGGSDNIDNIVIACPKCNQSKHAKLPHEWPKGGRLL